MSEVWKPSVTVAAIIERDGRYLLVEEHTPEGLRLNNPAGHLEPGESPTLLRVRAADPAGEERAWLQAYREGVLTSLLQGKGRQAANNRIFWGRVDDVGYLNILTMGAFARNAARDTRPPALVITRSPAAGTARSTASRCRCEGWSV